MNRSKSGGQGILSIVGNTPVVPLNTLYSSAPRRLYAKLEMFNPGGSIKDRPAFLMIEKAFEKEQIQSGDTIIESSSGNMAIGLAQACCYYGLNMLVVTDPKINAHTLQILKAYGARIEKVTRSNENGNYLAARLDRVRTLVKEHEDFYWPNQYASKWNPAAHYRTMEEIVEALGEPPDYLLAATSTCGTIMGCANYVQHHGLNTKIVAVDAAGSVIFGAQASERLIPGHGAGRPSPLLRREAIDRVIHITDEECVWGCRRLLNTEGILAGGSSGAVVAAVEKLRSDLPDHATCVGIFPDSGERYLNTIFNDKWVRQHIGKTTIQVDALAESDSERSNEATNGRDSTETESQKIAIVGGGPKGMYGFERLAAEFKSHAPDENIEIHLFNRTSHFGSGDIYRTDQPSYLLTNTVANQINMWIDEVPPPVIQHPLSLTKWLKAHDLAENGYVSRATVGEYLEDGFEKIVDQLSPGLSVKCIIGEVVDIIEDKENKLSVEFSPPDGSRQLLDHAYDYILLATGHPKNKFQGESWKLQNLAQSNVPFQFVPHIYPVEEQLKAIAAGSIVGIKGIGLTFVDAVLALTEGRGGTFEQNEKNDRFDYQPSGREPEVIYPFSRSGLPMISREEPTETDFPLRFLTDKRLTALRDSQDGPLDFKKKILSLLKKELTFTFYQKKLKKSSLNVDLCRASSFEEMKRHINDFHARHPEVERFDVDNFLNPLADKEFRDGRTFHQYIEKYLQFFISKAREKEPGSAWAALSTVWRRAAPAFGKMYAFGGLTPQSQWYFDQQYRRRLERVTFGPPAESMEKILCLMKTGRIDFSLAQNPSTVINNASDTVVLESKCDAIRQNVDAIIDARIAPVSLVNNQSSLYKKLLERGMITKYEREQDGLTYHPGNAAVSPCGAVINKAGREDRRITLTGTPTEGITYDNDTLSRRRNNFVSDWAAFVRKKCTEHKRVPC